MPNHSYVSNIERRQIELDKEYLDVTLPDREEFFEPEVEDVLM